MLNLLFQHSNQFAQEVHEFYIVREPHGHWQLDILSKYWKGRFNAKYVHFQKMISMKNLAFKCKHKIRIVMLILKIHELSNKAGS